MNEPVQDRLNFAFQLPRTMLSWVRHSVKGRQFGFLVILPFLLIAAYFLLLAPDRYVTTAAMLVEESGSPKMGAGFMEGLGFDASADKIDERLLKAFIISSNMIEKLDRDMFVRDHFSSTRDFLLGLRQGHTYEEFLEFYREYITIKTDSDSGILMLEVHAYNPTYAKQLAEAILNHSEDFINESSQMIAGTEMQFALDEVNRSQLLLKSAKKKILSFQNQYNLMSPDTKGESLFVIISELEGELAKTQAAINQSESYLIENAPPLKRLKVKADSLSKEILMQKDRIIGSDKSSALNDLNMEYQTLLMDLEKSTSLYNSSIAAYEISRVQSVKQLKHLIIASRPYLAEESLYPRRGYWLITAFVGLLVVWGIVGVVYASLLEHKD